MPTSTLQPIPALPIPPQGFYVASGDGSSFRSYRRNANGTGFIEGLKIFKAGTFKDSMGFQRTWEIEHLEQMVFNFNLLADRGLFPNVPLRDGHPELFGSGGAVIGYVQNPSRDDGFLIADLEITEPDAFGKWERGTFRARSLEVGMYETNDEASFWPVIMGLAFVDIPAVEGLYSKYSNPARRPERSKFHFSQTVVDTAEEATVPQTDTTQGNEGTPPATPPAPAPAAPAATAPAPAAPAAPAPTAPTAPAAPAAPATFSVNGAQTSDFAAVQQHIATLEQFRAATMEAGRRDYVKALAANHKIAATQIEGLTAFALGLSDTQWDAFRAGYDAAPEVPLFGQHAAGGGGTPTPSADDARKDEISVLEGQLAMHKRAGMTPENIEKLTAYKRLKALQTSGTAA